MIHFDIPVLLIGLGVAGFIGLALHNWLLDHHGHHAQHFSPRRR